MVKITNITKDIRLRQNIPSEINGLLITNVEQNTDAERKGLRPGDIIQEINQNPVSNMSEFIKIINVIKTSKKGVLLLVNRQGNINFYALKFIN